MGAVNGRRLMCTKKLAHYLGSERGDTGATLPSYTVECCLRVKTPHFHGLVRAPLTGPRISMATHICLESPLYTVSENTIKSGIRFILGSLYRFWSKRCNFRSVRHPIRSRFFIHWKALKNLHKWYQFSGADQVAKLVHYCTLNTPPVTVLRP